MKSQLTLRLPDTQSEKPDCFATRMKRKRSDVVRLVIEQFLGDLKFRLTLDFVAKQVAQVMRHGKAVKHNASRRLRVCAIVIRARSKLC